MTNEVPQNSDSITISRRTLLLALLLPLFFGLGLGSGYLLWGRVPAATPAAQVEIPKNITRYDVPVDDDPVLGPADAPITIIEFSDYECPFCRKWYQEVLLPLLDKYPDQIRFVYRDLPLTSLHANAFPAAEAANCAGEQGKYWEYHNALFEMPFALGRDAFIQLATDLGLNVEDFTGCIDSRRYRDEVEADFQFAVNLGIQSTPTFFVNGIAIVGAQPYAVFEQVIEKELAGEIE
jgi:protein-disulfide isomerase